MDGDRDGDEYERDSVVVFVVEWLPGTLQDGGEGGGGDDRNPLKGLEGEQVLVATDEVFGMARAGERKDVIVRLSSDRAVGDLGGSSAATSSARSDLPPQRLSRPRRGELRGPGGDHPRCGFIGADSDGGPLAGDLLFG